MKHCMAENSLFRNLLGVYPGFPIQNKIVMHVISPMQCNILTYFELNFRSTLNKINMQVPNEDTEWNDALRRHGILPA